MSGPTYELAAPGRFSAHDLADICSEVVGAEVSAERLSSDDFMRMMVGDPDTVPYQAGVSRAISAYYSSHDFIGNSHVLSWLLGHPPTTFADFVRLHYRAHEQTRPALGSSGSLSALLVEPHDRNRGWTPSAT